jgi:periplasmic glucans biosynthesis protein
MHPSRANRTFVFVPAVPSRRVSPAMFVFVLLCLLAHEKALAFGFNDVVLRAKGLAAAPFQKPAVSLPKELQDLSYEQYWDIRLKPEKTLWRNTGQPFEIGFFHPGYHYDTPVKINEVTSKKTREIKFNPEAFDYGANKIDPKLARELGFAGFRVHYPVNTPKYKDEVLAFLGASYFRALGKDQLYGASARGLAIDTALNSGEEFPRFVEFWIERPSPTADELIIYGLLDSPRATGAYRFVLKAGVETALDVKARFYLRDNVGKFGVAPLTSMFSFGENQRPERDDYRPEVHDSDGLSVHLSNGEWIWRPLANPKRLLVTSFAITDPQGFGLMQRDREFSHYEQLDSRYDVRPSIWVQPKSPWGAGRIELVQIPAPDETNDNVVAYWIPDTPPRPKEPYDVEYRLLWQRVTDARPAHAWVVQTRRGHGYVRTADNSIAFVVDFDGPALRKLAPEAGVEGVISMDPNGELLESKTRRNDVSGTWRMTLRVRRLDDTKPLELRAHLRGNNQSTLSETWSYIVPPG